MEDIFPVYANLPLSPRKARHFPPHAGEATAKEEKNYIFIDCINAYFLMYLHYSFPHFLCGSAKNKSIPNFIILSLCLNVNIRLPNSPNHLYFYFTSFLSS